jgi:hypothetical protein
MRFEGGVAAPTFAADSNGVGFSVPTNLAEESAAIGVADDSAGWHPDEARLRIGSVHVLAPAGSTAACGEVGFAAEVEEAAQAAIADEHHIAAAAAVATGGATAGLEPLAKEGNGAAAARAGGDEDFGAVKRAGAGGPGLASFTRRIDTRVGVAKAVGLLLGKKLLGKGG